MLAMPTAATAAWVRHDAEADAAQRAEWSAQLARLDTEMATRGIAAPETRAWQLGVGGDGRVVRLVEANGARSSTAVEIKPRGQWSSCFAAAH